MADYVAVDEDWKTLSRFLPPDWKELARTTNALKGLRQDKDADRLFRTLMLHVGCGYSLRETVVRAREAGMADLSDVALLKRLRKCENWLHALAVGLWEPRRWPKEKTKASSAESVGEIFLYSFAIGLYSMRYNATDALSDWIRTRRRQSSIPAAGGRAAATSF